MLLNRLGRKCKPLEQQRAIAPEKRRRVDLAAGGRIPHTWRPSASNATGAVRFPSGSPRLATLGVVSSGDSQTLRLQPAASPFGCDSHPAAPPFHQHSQTAPSSLKSGHVRAAELAHQRPHPVALREGADVERTSLGPAGSAVFEPTTNCRFSAVPQAANSNIPPSTGRPSLRCVPRPLCLNAPRFQSSDPLSSQATWRS